MNLIVDTNKIVASLLRDGKVRRVLFLPGLELYAPKYSLEEIKKHEDFFISKTSKTSFEFLLSRIRSKINFIIVNDPEILEQAKSIAKNFDLYDYPFIALSLKLNAPIWTNDKQMIVYGWRTGEYTALDTRAVEELIKGKSIEEILEGLRKRYLTE